MKTYWAAFLMRAKMEAQYRAAALSGLATQLFFGLILVYLYRGYTARAPIWPRWPPRPLMCGFSRRFSAWSARTTTR